MRTPISRVRSVTLTSMMFMIPMPPTTSDTTAIAASSAVRVCVPCCWALAISVRLRMLKSSSSRRLQVVAIAEQRRDLLLRAPRILGRDGAHDDGAGDVLLQAALDLVLEGRDWDERRVVVVRAHGRLPLALQQTHDEEGHRADAHRLADGIDARAEELLGDRRAEDDDLGARLDVRCRRRASPCRWASCGCRRTRATSR